MSASDGYVFPGYTLQEDLTLLPDRDENGDIVNPDLVCKLDILCDYCKMVISVIEAEYDPGKDSRKEGKVVHVPYHASEARATESIKRGCGLCAIFQTHEKYKDLSDSIPTSRPIHLESWVCIQRKDSVSASFMQWSMFDIRQLRHDKPRNPVLCVLIRPSKPLRESKLKALSVSNSSEGTFKLASSLLNDCIWGHKNCAQNRPIPFQSPKRLLDIGNEKCHQVQVICPRKPVPYLTVSHCWGQVDNLTLNSNTYHELTAAFNVSKLPRLWRDFVKVTQRLGYRYLWIDSLCIQQDNEEDKQEEIIKMGDIYGGSICNIATVSAPDSTDSLFTVKLSSIVQHLEILHNH